MSAGGNRNKLLPNVEPAGGFRPQRKLTEWDVVQIFGALRCGADPDLIGWEFGVTGKTIRDIRAGRTWSELPRPQFPSTRKHLNNYLVAQAVELLAMGATIREAAKAVGTTRSTLHRELRILRKQQGIDDTLKPGDARRWGRERSGTDLKYDGIDPAFRDAGGDDHSDG